MSTWLTARQASQKTGIPETSLYKWRSMDTGPITRKVRGRVYWNLRDLEIFIAGEVQSDKAKREAMSLS